ncbi:uncharacterized protein LOC135495273 [Lineus longissimus]|uniref:uncharacterized protein LOC135495273 n=1 Tax=Lineus longissimus TaxID=88925 RepID=UPI00315C8D84
MGMNQVYTYIYEHCVKHSMTRVIDELHKKSNCSSFLAKVSEPSLLIASIHSIIVNASLDHDTIKLLLDSVELLGQQFGEQCAEEFSPKKFLNLIHYIKALLVTNIILDEEIAVDEKVDELNKYFPADDDSPQSPAISPFDLNRVNYKRTQFRCYCLFFLASNKEPNNFLTPGQHQRMKGKVIQPAKYLIETVRGRLPETFIEKFCKKPPSARREMTFPNPVVRELLFEIHN